MDPLVAALIALMVVGVAVGMYQAKSPGDILPNLLGGPVIAIVLAVLAVVALGFVIDLLT